ncbi:MAG: aminotransferase class V-fold PLP-dependent enzyme [Candidatus Heimdallarchaeota archaeon]|nr:aminotransferase class V-fold PLP-dependent enzyme [Candidatus Heimdallarchaeota archaeon]
MSKDDMSLEEGLVYLNNASIGPLPTKSLNMLHTKNEEQARVGEKKIDYAAIDTLWNDLRHKVSTLVGGKKEGVTITKNTASALHIAADSLYPRIKKGMNIVMPDAEFVTNSYVWQQLAHRYGLEIRYVPTEQHRIDVSSWEKLVDDQTLLCSLSSVQFSGFRSDLASISEIAHDHGALVSVDAIQQLGAVPFDIRQNDVDFVSAAGYKWLLAPQGTGLFYIRPELLEELDSILVGWFSSKEYTTLYHIPFAPFDDARKFQLSMIDPTYNAFDVSLEHILRWNVSKSYTNIIQLLDYFIDELSALKSYRVVNSLQADERSGILIVQSDHHAPELVAHLAEQNITVSSRTGGIRVSPHAYNTKEDIDRLIEGLRSFHH